MSLITKANYYAQTREEAVPNYAQGKEEAVKGFQIMETLRQGAKSAPGVRVMFSTEETEAITLFFQEYIDAGIAPSSAQCKEFLDNRPLQCDPKQVRDKVRHLMKLRK